MKSIAAMIFAVFGLYAVLLPLAEAGGNTWRADRREFKQQQRIQRGMTSGKLTPNEAQKLINQQQNIQQMEMQMKADGVVTRRERVLLNRRQNQASRNIYRKKHNVRRLYR